MKLKMVFVSLFTFIIPILTPYGYWVFSYADPFLVMRDLVVDSMGTRSLLARIWRFIIILLALGILYFYLHKDKLAIISLFTSILSETVDFVLTYLYFDLKFRPYITIFSRIFDISFFTFMVVICGALTELDYNMFIDAFLMCIVYFIMFQFAKKTFLFKDYHQKNIVKSKA